MGMWKVQCMCEALSSLFISLLPPPTGLLPSTARSAQTLLSAGLLTRQPQKTELVSNMESRNLLDGS